MWSIRAILVNYCSETAQKNEKREKKFKKGVDIRVGDVVFYPSAQGNGPRERDREGARILKTIQSRLEETTVNSEMSFDL